jgi:hypothetical protein
MFRILTKAFDRIRKRLAGDWQALDPQKPEAPHPGKRQRKPKRRRSR